MKRLVFATLFIIYTISINNFNAETDTIFLLYTSKNIQTPQILKPKDRQSLLESNFNPIHPVRIIIHGYRDAPHAVICVKGREAYAAKGDFNVIIVDWSKGASTFNFLVAKQRIYLIGPIIAQFIEFVLETYKDALTLADVYLIGHSLGAHLAGVVGKSMKVGKILVILGLDPTGIFFRAEEPHERLDKGDAEYVEVIHTNGALQGFGEPLGTADFYPNYGQKQPGCGLDLNGACSHQRSAYLWVESIASHEGFWSVPCSSYEEIKNLSCPKVMKGSNVVKMGGEPANKGGAHGIYYLQTASESPFALGAK